MDWQAFWLTVRLSALVAAILVVMGLPVAYWITYSRWRWKFLAEAVFALPIVLPPTVLGFYVLVALGPHSPLGRGWEALTGSHPGVYLRRPGDRLDRVQSSRSRCSLSRPRLRRWIRGWWRLRRPWELPESGHSFASSCLCRSPAWSPEWLSASPTPWASLAWC